MTPLAAARREAGKWLSHYDEGVRAVPAGSVDTPEVRLLRALLAALPEEPAVDRAAAPGQAHLDEIGEPPDAKGNCAGCNGRGFVLVGDGHRGELCACVAAPAPPDAVREAAELLRFEIDALPRPDLKYATLNTEAVRTLLAALASRGAKGGE